MFHIFSIMKPADITGKKEKIYKISFWVILAIALFLRSYQYFINRSLWHDEAHLALNFVDFGFKDLSKPLEHYQSAPIFFLWSIEALSRIFGLGEMSLRIVPFVFSIIAVPLFYHLVLSITKNKLTATIAFLIYAVNLSFVYYASELKPYTIDVSAYIILIYLLVTNNGFVARYRTLLLICSGCLLAFFSNATAVIFLCCTLYYIMQVRITNIGAEKMFVIPLRNICILGAWFAAFALNYLLFVHDHPYAEGMRQIWAYTFCPTPFFGPEFNEYMKHYFTDLFLNDLFLVDRTYYIGYILLLLAIAGIAFALLRKQYLLLLFGLLPIAIAYLFSILKLYPFYPRFILYTFPGLIIIISNGISHLVLVFNNKGYRMVSGLMVGLFLVLLLKNSILTFPKWEIRIKPSLAYINKRFPNTTIFVTTPYTMTEYYYKTGFLKNGDIKSLGWHLDAHALLKDENVQKQTHPFIILHSVTGGDNAEVFIKELKERGLVLSEFKNNNFGVTEIKPESYR